MENTQKMRELNDAFRTTFVGGQVVVTRGIQQLPDISKVLLKVREFSEFNADCDPYHEHDFGAFLYDETQIFWKLDYYDLDLQNGSPDPADVTVTRRILTVMLAGEY